MELIDFIENHWKVLSFLATELGVFLMFSFAIIQAVKCLLRNDILAIYDRCKDEKKITLWQLDSIEKSFKLYKTLRGNSFIEDLVKKVRTFEIIE